MWTVKALSELSGVSVQTLHHYDRVGLLTPTLRQDNGYRHYSEADLARLQQIIACKFFGFSLKEIGVLLDNEKPLHESLALQAKLLDKKLERLQDAKQELDNLVDKLDKVGEVDWQTICELIKVYKMTEDIEKTWAGEALNAAEIKQLAEFQKSVEERFTIEQREAFGENFKRMVNEVKENMTQCEPSSEFGLRIAAEFMAQRNTIYGTKHNNVSRVLWDKGFRKGKMDINPDMTVEVVQWLDKAISALWTKRISDLLEQIGQIDDAALVAKWHINMVEWLGDDRSFAAELIERVVSDERTTNEQKEWLKDNLQQ